jgi:Xaa-Pro dipeptidase
VTLLDQLLQAAPPNDLAFSIEEYQARLARVRECMAAAGLETLVLTSAPNLLYLTGYETIMPTCYAVAVVPRSGDVVLHLPEEDIPCALTTGWVREFVFFDWAQPLDAATQLVTLLRERGHDKGRIGVESRPVETYAYGAMNAHTYLVLEKGLTEATLVDATQLVPDVRLVKSEAELDYMRRAGRLTQLGVRASLERATAGATDNDLAVAGYSAMVGAGSEWMSVDPIVLVGRRGAFCAPHATQKRTEMKEGDAIQLEYSGNWRRYNAPLIRSGCIGAPSEGVRRLADCCLATVELLLANIRAGRTGHDVACLARHGFDDADPRTVFHGGYGYAVGAAFQPTWTEAPMYISEGFDRELAPDMTLHLPIWSWVPGEFSLGFSETVRVTPDGCELLTPGEERELVIR